MEGYGREDSGMKNPAVVDLGLANLTLNTFLSETVNEISEVYLFVNIPMLLATIAVNIWVIKVVEEKKTGRVTGLIVWDCLANIGTMALMLAVHSPLLPLSSSLSCLILVFSIYATSW